MLPSNNAPNPKKFLKEVQGLIPIMQANGIIPSQNGDAPRVSRAQARAMGYKNSKDANYLRDEQDRKNKEHNWRAQRIGETVEKEIKALHPTITRFANMTGWMWLYKLVFLSWNVKGGKDEVEGVPDIECSWINLYRFGKTIKIIRLVWEDHNKKKRIIT